jgi:hypothetical protein
MSSAPSEADLLLTGGRVHTVDDADHIVEAVAIRGGRIVAAGTTAALAAFAGPRTRTVHLGGRSVVPGLIDGHAHMEREALKRLRPSLAGASCVAEVLARVSAAAAATPRGRWVVTMPLGDPPFFFGGPDALAERRLPTRAELDAAAPDHPVCIPGAFGNWGRPPGWTVLNSAGLASAGITAASRPACDGVRVELDAASGEPTGVIVEDNYRPSLEFDLLRDLPCFDYGQRRQALLDSIPIYQALGTTSIYEGHGSAPESIAIYRDLWERGQLTVRTCLCVSPTWSDLHEARLAMRDWLAYARGRGMGDPWLRICGVYLGLGGDPAHAALARAALPNTGWTGYVEWAHGIAEFRELATIAASHDLRVNAVVGERLPEVLDALEAVDRAYPLRDRRWVIEHIGRMRPDDLPRIRALGLMVTTIPTYSLWKDGDAYLDDPDGGAWTLPHRALMAAGLPIAAGTDNVPCSPFWPMWAAIARVERTTGRVLGTEQALDRRQALRLMTIEGARLSFEEDVKGSIALDALRNVSSLMTVVGGRIVHHRPWN